MRPFGPDSPWRLDPEFTFLNHGSFGACPVPVLEYQRSLIDRLEARPIQFLDRDLLELMDGARREVATFIGADPDGLVVVPNATAGVVTVLRSLRFRSGDELLTTDHEYNAILTALQAVAEDQRAVVVRAAIPLPVRHPEEIVEALLSAVTPRTRIAVVSHVTSPTGIVLPIETIVRELDRLGVDTVVDAAHSPGMVHVDLAALNAAFWTGNGHKWLCGPKGSGVLHIREDRRDRIRPLVTSHGRNDPRTDRSRLRKEFDWQGTLDPTAFLALPEAIRVVGALDPGGWAGLMAANRATALTARVQLQAALGVEPIAPDELIGSMAAVRLPTLTSDADAAALNLALSDEDRIEVPITGWPVRGARQTVSDPPSAVFVRVSAQRYNEPVDFGRLAHALARRGLGSSPGRDHARPRLS
ncbi:MAG TPA: aminotransferase class V-fold PLP-dependent enzyme [Candidatus Limnocylindrales bacterium]|nr:aminotransferase class V-fold PLP-dependent enzyme [Candidatus Limnocylindrales bacterium]